MREPAAHRTEQWAVDEAARIVRHELGWVYTEPHGREYGVDAFAEVREPDADAIITGELLGLQIKGGDWYFRRPAGNGQGWVFRDSGDHLAYWLGHSTPVIVILVRPGSSAAYWQVITPETAKETGDSFTVLIPASQPFDASARGRLAAIAAWPPKVGREFGQNLACLPPAAARYLTAAAAGDRLGAARLADRLAAGRYHPLTAAQMLTRQPPPWIAGSPAAADLWLAVARYASEHGGSRDGHVQAAAAFLAAADATSGTRSARARASAGLLLADADPDAARAHLEQARAAGQVLLADAGLASLRREDPGRAAAIVESLRRVADTELDQEPAALAVLGRAAIQAGDPGAAVGYHSRALEAASRYHETTSARLVLADALRRLALTNPDHSAVDFDQAAAHARAVLQARRAWDGPGAEALAVLLDVLLARGDVRGAVDAALPAALGGAARDWEATDPAVAMRAASAAQAVGDVAAYNYFTAALPRGGTSRKVLKAAAQRPRPPSKAAQIETWSGLLGEALDVGDDQQAVTCVTALARLGRWPVQADAIAGRALPPDTAATIRAVALARAGDPVAVSDLRDLASGNVIAALELILLIEDTDGPDAAIAECERQAQGRMHAQLTLRHIDLLGKSGRDDDAAALAAQIIPDPAYPLDVRHKLCAWHAGRAAQAGDHAEAARIARAGLSAGPDDTVAWVLIGSLFLQGRARAAREAHARHHPDPGTEGHARLFTDLHRGVPVSAGDARAMAAVAARQPAGSCRDALARMLHREMTLAARAGQPWPDSLADDVRVLASPGQPQPDTGQLQERETARHAAVTSVQAGQAPQADIAAAAGLTYGYVLLARMAGFTPAADLAPGLRQAGQAAARTALSLGRCAADLSAFQTLAQLPGPDRAEIRARIPDLAAVPAAGLDITMTRDTLRTVAALPPESPGHPDAGLPEQMDLAGRIERDVDQSGRLDPGTAGQTAALDIIAAAARAELPLWCDDSVLRQRARAAGVAAFSVVDLLTELIQAAGQDAAGREPAWRALAGQYVTDLPIGAGTIITLAGDWQPGPTHTAIARPGWWQYHAASWAGEWLAIAAAAAGSGDPGNLTSLTLAALTGALQAVAPGLRTQRYQQLAAVTLIACHDARAQPSPGLLAAMADYAGPSVAARPGYVLGELITRLRARDRTLDPVGIATTLLPGISPV